MVEDRSTAQFSNKSAFEFGLHHRPPSSIMSATSGIQPSQDLTTTFAKAVESNSTRFIKVSIQNGSLDPILQLD
jgi:hypothetical protein